MMVSNSMPTIKEFGFGFLTGSEWKPAESIFGALPFIYGTIVSSLIALIISVPISSRHRHFSDRTSSEKDCDTDRVYGRTACGDSFGCLRTLGNFRSRAVHTRLSRSVFGNIFRLDSGFGQLFQGRLTGIGMLTGGIILALMTTPIITAVVRDILEVVPTTTARSRACARRDEMGNDADRSGKCRFGNRRRGRSRSWDAHSAKRWR